MDKKYKVGDKVRIKQVSGFGKSYEYVYGTVTAIVTGEAHYDYCVEIDGINFAIAEDDILNDSSEKKQDELPRTEVTTIKNEDVVNHPHHYADSCSIECIESMIIAFGAEAVYNFCICNAYKYLWRYKNKNGREDLKKASWYVVTASKLIVVYNLDEESDDVTNLSKLIDEKLNSIEG